MVEKNISKFKVSDRITEVQNYGISADRTKTKCLFDLGGIIIQIKQSVSIISENSPRIFLLRLRNEYSPSNKI